MRRGRPLALGVDAPSGGGGSVSFDATCHEIFERLKTSIVIGWYVCIADGAFFPCFL